MLEKILQTKTFLTAQGALDGLAARHAALSDNLANVNTPGYKRKEVPFEAALRRAVGETLSPQTGVPARPMRGYAPQPVRGYAPQPVRGYAPQPVRDLSSSARMDGNNVDIEREVVQMAENTLRYQTLTQYISGFFSGLKSVINNGR
jgi:flagellar basal-body rod protein FlgB